jgi:hypothetical protein
MIRRFVVLMAVLLGAFASTGYAEEASQLVLQTKVSGRFPGCEFSPPTWVNGTPGIADRGFFFLPAKVELGPPFEGVFATWYTFDFQAGQLNFIAGIWPLSAVTILEKNWRNYSLRFTGDDQSAIQCFCPTPTGNPQPCACPTGASLDVVCTRAPARSEAFDFYKSIVQRGSFTEERFFPLESWSPTYVGPYFYDIKIVNGSYNLTSAFIGAPGGGLGGSINGVSPVDPAFFPKLLGELQTYSGQYQRIIQFIFKSAGSQKK